jgi:hypothetical protein
MPGLGCVSHGSSAAAVAARTARRANAAIRKPNRATSGLRESPAGVVYHANVVYDANLKKYLITAPAAGLGWLDKEVVRIFPKKE